MAHYFICRTLQRKKESHKRNLYFHLPVAVPCGPSMRLMQNDSSYVTLADIYEQYCESTGILREDPMFLIGEKSKNILRELKKINPRQVLYHTVLLLRKD